ncbi:hypothetical protein AVEN_90074-1 [Araneus ventricosus]|uniref:Uncharacterized protein n=1 Tax=Araneus ventricosus TaxID=182803 RepID=A0A4Y2LR18_ARAVE|nr:hypothetical protein AVEN_90074-1 [Araneus ventricosus]
MVICDIVGVLRLFIYYGDGSGEQATAAFASQPVFGIWLPPYSSTVLGLLVLPVRNYYRWLYRLLVVICRLLPVLIRDYCIVRICRFVGDTLHAVVDLLVVCCGFSLPFYTTLPVAFDFGPLFNAVDILMLFLKDFVLNIVSICKVFASKMLFQWTNRYAVRWML